jgi:DNA-binding XRE family transcriptional regulator
MAIPMKEDHQKDDITDPVAPDAEKILVNCSTVKGRIELIRQERNMSKAAFAKSIGLTPQGYQFVIKNDQISDQAAIALEYRHGFSVEWVKTGSGEPRIDQWENIRKEIEDTILREINSFFSQKLRRTRPMLVDKDNHAKQF